MGSRLANAPVRMETRSIKDRQGKIRSDSGLLHVHNLITGEKSTGRNFLFRTNIIGEVVLRLSDPQGIGVKTELEFIADDYISKRVFFTFTVVTSPDSPDANMYGHMQDIIEVNKVKFLRPPLMQEYRGDVVRHHLNEDWAALTWDNGIYYCRTLKHGDIPTKYKLKYLLDAHSNDIFTVYGWPIVKDFVEVWTSSWIWQAYIPRPYYYYYDFAKKEEVEGINSSSFAVTCEVK
ncbi:hypothetical protein GJT83_02450 (plasmid) [Enterobacteriaceae endosymbiont of Plateumaris pusilla]|nr:hypothetical protein GJT83_02450 [Enterobacteriaceae endosymbiont of Plateumaris pusilla]